VRAIVRGQARRAPAIRKFDGSRVVFADDSRFEPDLVILCTGFETRTPFLAGGTASEPRYLHTFAPKLAIH